MRKFGTSGEGEREGWKDGRMRGEERRGEERRRGKERRRDAGNEAGE